MIVFLNGCSSSGKTTIARAIQHLSDEPWLLVGIDTFFQMMPSKYVGFGEKASEGFHFISEQDEEGPIIRIESGSFGSAVMKSSLKVVKILADNGHHLIVDEVLFTEEELENYVQALVGHTVCFIGVMCDLKTLQEREILRGDRAHGLARDQITRVHGLSRPYDLTVDTANMAAFDCAEKILVFANNMHSSQSFK